MICNACKKENIELTATPIEDFFVCLYCRNALDLDSFVNPKKTKKLVQTALDQIEYCVKDGRPNSICPCCLPKIVKSLLKAIAI